MKKNKIIKGLLIALFVIVLFAPSLYYGLIKNEIVFVPAKFVEEWLKTILTGVVLYFILKEFETRMQKRDSDFETSMIEQSISNLLKDLIIENLEHDKSFTKIREHWIKLDLIKQSSAVKKTKYHNFLHTDSDYQLISNIIKDIEDQPEVEINKLVSLLQSKI